MDEARVLRRFRNTSITGVLGGGIVQCDIQKAKNGEDLSVWLKDGSIIPLRLLKMENGTAIGVALADYSESSDVGFDIERNDVVSVDCKNGRWALMDDAVKNYAWMPTAKNRRTICPSSGEPFEVFDGLTTCDSADCRKELEFVVPLLIEASDDLSVFDVARELYHLTLGYDIFDDYLDMLPSVWKDCIVNKSDKVDSFFDDIIWEEFAKMLKERHTQRFTFDVHELTKRLDIQCISDSARIDAQKAKVVVPASIGCAYELPFVMRYQWMLHFGSFVESFGKGPESWGEKEESELLEKGNCSQVAFLSVCCQPGMWEWHFWELTNNLPRLEEWREDYPDDPVGFWKEVKH